MYLFSVTNEGINKKKNQINVKTYAVIQKQ